MKVKMKLNEMPYQRITIEEIEKRYKTEVKGAYLNAKNAAEQFEAHKKSYALNADVSTMVKLSNIRHDGDMTNEFYDEEHAYYDEIAPKYTVFSVDHIKDLYESEYRSELEKIIGSVAFKNIELSIQSFDSKLVPLLQEENVLKSTYSKLCASAKIDWDGEILNLSLLRKYQVHPDREIRRRACRLGAEFFEKNADAMDSIYDKLVKNRTKQAKILGYDNYIPLGYGRMRRNCYGVEQVEAFREQVKKVLVPFAEKLHERRRKRLGLEELHYCDEVINFKEGDPAPMKSPEEILVDGQKMYSELSKETKEFFDFMMDGELFDVFGRKDKRSGGYMDFLPNYRAPFIFANFNGTAGDIDVITHECGHAFQGFVQRNEEIREFTNITMETAEVHSMSMEFFTEPWMELFFGDRTEDYNRMHLEEAVTFIPYGCMVDEFQHIVYANPDMTPEERHAEWKKLETVYKPHLNYEEETYFAKGGFWQKQSHIFLSPFYYIDYSIAQTCALQFKIKMDENYKEAWSKYLELCKLGAKDFFTNMIPQVGLKLPFEDGCLQGIVDELEKKLKM